MDKKGIILVSSQHIEAGIKKYQGRMDAGLLALIRNAGLNYTPYIFNDGRILLVLPQNSSAFLYSNREMLFDALDLEQATQK